MKQVAGSLVSGQFVKLPVYLAGEHRGEAFQGPVLVELNPDVPGNVLLQHPGGTYECSATDELDVLPRPTIAAVRSVSGGLGRVALLVCCCDSLVAAGWPALAREQFVEVASQGGLEHLLRTIHEVFDAAA